MEQSPELAMKNSHDSVHMRLNHKISHTNQRTLPTDWDDRVFHNRDIYKTLGWPNGHMLQNDNCFRSSQRTHHLVRGGEGCYTLGIDTNRLSAWHLSQNDCMIGCDMCFHRSRDSLLGDGDDKNGRSQGTSTGA